MMLPTHAVVGLAVATPLVFLAPDQAHVGLWGALLGSVVPDFDLYAGHRRTLHYPTAYTIAVVPAVLAAVILQSPAVILLASLLVGAALHCRMDRYGGGLELRPWEGTSNRAVYDHVRGEWRAPKRWLRYDGAPEDVALSVGLGIPLFLALNTPFQWITAAAVTIGLTYALLRRRLAALAPVVFESVPDSLGGYVPDRYRG